MPFTTIALDKIPEAKQFAPKTLYEDKDVDEAIAVIKRPEAIGNGVKYEKKQQARNAARTLQDRIIKKDATLLTDVIVMGTEKDGKDGPFVWYLRPKKQEAPAAPATK